MKASRILNKEPFVATQVHSSSSVQQTTSAPSATVSAKPLINISDDSSKRTLLSVFSLPFNCLFSIFCFFLFSFFSDFSSARNDKHIATNNDIFPENDLLGFTSSTSPHGVTTASKVVFSFVACFVFCYCYCFIHLIFSAVFNLFLVFY
jgi:hypothetical protein